MHIYSYNEMSNNFSMQLCNFISLSENSESIGSFYLQDWFLSMNFSISIWMILTQPLFQDS